MCDLVFKLNISLNRVNYLEIRQMSLRIDKLLQKEVSSTFEKLAIFLKNSDKQDICKVSTGDTSPLYSPFWDKYLLYHNIDNYQLSAVQ